MKAGKDFLETVLVCIKTTQICGSVDGAGEWLPMLHTCTFALSMPTYNNFQISHSLVPGNSKTKRKKKLLAMSKRKKLAIGQIIQCGSGYE